MGVWIETPDEQKNRRAQNVTPFVGVWIETDNAAKTQLRIAVTPFVGVWIETTTIMIVQSVYVSHPSWVCGLKLLGNAKRTPSVESHPSWVCGLKLHLLI